MGEITSKSIGNEGEAAKWSPHKTKGVLLRCFRKVICLCAFNIEVVCVRPARRSFFWRTDSKVIQFYRREKIPRGTIEF